MTRELEQKKEYTAPIMEVIELQRQNVLLDCSTCDDDNVDVEFVK